MRQTPSQWTALAALALLFQVTALADLNQTVTLQANAALNLETGATASSGGDILWNGTTITPQGNATAVHIGDIPFNVATQGVLTFLPGYSKSPIAATDLKVNEVFAVHTNANRYARVLVQAKSGSSITLQFTTFGAPANTSGGPTITAILNNSSRIARGLPNYGVAPSSLFVVVGNALADAGVPVLQSSQPPGLPLTLNGASITVVVNGVTTRPPLYYTSPGQLAAVLPANTPIGTGTLTVTYKGVTTAPAPIQVVPVALGINTYDVNTGVATDSVTGAVLTYTNSGAPGQTIILWTTGLGADPEDSDTVFTSTPHSVNTPLQIYIGGIAATILYQGASGYPGVNQINLTIPPSVPTGCWVPLAAVTGSVVSNVVTLPINTGGGACTDATSGLNGTQISGGTTTFRTGLVSLGLTNDPGSGGTRTVSNSATAVFGRYTGLSYNPPNSVSPGGCIVVGPAPIPSFTGLDPGVITLTGPGGLDVTLRSQLSIKGAFFANLASGALSSGGVYTFKGTGGADVGSFTSTVTLTSPLLTWTNPTSAATIDKTQGLRVTWTGGTPGSFVAISGSAATVGSSGASLITAGYICLAPVDAGQFTVPPYILLALPNGNGATLVQNIINSPLSASGLDISLALGTNSYSVASTYGSISR